MPSRLTGFVCPTVSMVTTGHATGVEKTLLMIYDLLYLAENYGSYEFKIDFFTFTFLNMDISITIYAVNLNFQCILLRLFLREGCLKLFI